METKRLYDIAKKNNITVNSFELPMTGAVALNFNGEFYIGIDPAVISNECKEKVFLAHEIGHCKTVSFYTEKDGAKKRKQEETKAQTWAFKRLIPISMLKKAIKNGDTSVFALAQHFGVTESFMSDALNYYSNEKDR